MNGKIMVGDNEIAKEFNKYFSELGKKLEEEITYNDIDPLHLVTPMSNSFTLKIVSKEDVNRIISGIDEISYLNSYKQL